MKKNWLYIFIAGIILTTQTGYISTNGTSNQLKRTQIIVNFSPSSARIYGDIYIDGKKQVEGATEVQIPLNAGTHTVEARNIKDINMFSGDNSYTYRNVKTQVTLKSGQSKTITLRPQKEYSGGFLTIKCTFKKYKKSIDYPLIADILIDERIVQGCSPESSKVTIPLPPGKYIVIVELRKGTPYRSSEYYKPPFIKNSVSISKGKTTSLSAKFEPK